MWCSSMGTADTWPPDRGLRQTLMINSWAGQRATGHIHFQVRRKQKLLCGHPTGYLGHSYTKHPFVIYPMLKQNRRPCTLSGFILGSRNCLWSLDLLRTRLQKRSAQKQKAGRVRQRGRVALCYPGQLPLVQLFSEVHTEL